MLPFLAALVTVLVAVFAAASAAAATTTAAETRVRASAQDFTEIVGVTESVSPGQQLGNIAAEPGMVVATGVAANALPALPKALSGGTANTHVYFGASNGKNVYVGITNNLARRQGEHGSRFALDPIRSHQHQ